MARTSEGSSQLPFSLLLLLALLLSGAASAGPVNQSQPAVTEAEVLTVRRMPSIPPYSNVEAVSPSGRYVVFSSTGPASGQQDLHLVDLQGKRPVVDLSFCRDPTFVLDGEALVYWHHVWGLTNRLQLLPTGGRTPRSVFPAREDDSQNQRRYFNSAWNGRSGEVLTSFTPERGEPVIHAIRLRDGRERKLGPAGGRPRLSPDLRRLAGNASRTLSGSGVYSEKVWTADTNGKHYTGLISGRLLEWLDNQHLLISRNASLQPDSRAALVRVHVSTGETRLLATYPRDNQTALSPSRTWMAVTRDNGVDLISTVDGRSLRVLRRAANSLFWGGSDRELYVLDAQGWQKLFLRLKKGAPLEPIEPEALEVQLTPTTPSPWQPLTPNSGPWRTYRANSEVRCAAPAGSGIWLGLSDGLRRIDRNGKSVVLPTWASAFRNRSVEHILESGESLWLLTRRTAPFNSTTYCESALVHVDLQTGAVRQRHLVPNGFGTEQFLEQLVLADHPVTRESRSGGIRTWTKEGSSELQLKGTDQPLLAQCLLRGSDGAAWIGTRSGLLRWKTGETRASGWTEAHGLAGTTVLAMAEHEGRLWLGTPAGLSTLDLRSGTIQRLPARKVLGQEAVLQLLVIGDALIARGANWLAEYRNGRWRRWPLSATGMFHTDGRRLLRQSAAGTPLMFRAGGSHWKPLSELPQAGIAENSTATVLWEQGNLWCGHERTLSRLETGTGTWKRFALPPGTSHVTCLAVASGSLWVGLWRGGILEMDPSTGFVRRRFHRPRSRNTRPLNESDPEVSQLAVVGTSVYAETDSGLLRIEPAQQKVQNLEATYRRLLGSGPNALWLLNESPSNRRNSWLVEFNVVSRKSTVYEPFPIPSWDPLALEPGGIFWRIGSAAERLDRRGTILAAYPLPVEPRQLSVKALTWAEGHLWYAAEGQRHPVPYQPVLRRLRVSDQQWEEQPACPLSSVNQLVVAGGSLWVATGNGVAELPLNGR